MLYEENQSGSIKHSFHALDTLFSAIEVFAKNQNSSFKVEKITGGRLHLYSEGSPLETIDSVLAIARYAFGAVNTINQDEPKYKSLLDFEVRLGADNGKFYLFEFKSNDGYAELTSIGFAANYAAKLQSVAHDLQIAISKELYDELSQDKKKFFNGYTDVALKKYTDDPYYVATLSSELFNGPLSESQKNDIRERAAKVNLTDMSAENVRTKIDFNNLSRKTYKRLTGIPLLADVRGFTKQFADDDSNLEEMASKTQKILTGMYNEVVNADGEHIQFQGDREMALFHDYDSAKSGCTTRATLCAMRMIDIVGKNTGVSIGIGFDFGRLFAVKIGARDEKDRLLLGETVSTSDRLEDKHAGENQIAISKEVWEKLRIEDKGLAKVFKPKGNNIYVATIGYKEYQKQFIARDNERETRQRSYNPAWGCRQC